MKTKSYKRLFLSILSILALASCGEKVGDSTGTSSEKTVISSEESIEESSLIESSIESEESTPISYEESISEEETEESKEESSSIEVIESSEAFEESSEAISSESSIIEESSSEISTSSSEESSETESSSQESLSEESSIESSSEIESQPISNPGIICLDSNSSPTISSSSFIVNYGEYKFEFNDVSENDKGFISLSKGGYILNTTPFGDIDSFEVEYSIVETVEGKAQSDLGFGSLYYVTDTHEITSPRSYARTEVTNSSLITLDDNPNFLAFYSYNEIDIESITINYSTSATYTENFEDFDINLFATNDIHGQVNSDDSHAGINNASGKIEEQKSKYNLLLDQGDIYQGSLACYLTGGHIMDDYLLMNGYESTILGNHEWDWKEQNIVSHRDYCPEVKLLACNVRYKDGTTPSWVRNYYVTQRGGVKIGVIGALGDIIGDISADMVENINFIVGDELTSMIDQFATELKEQGCAYVILQIHAGSKYSGIQTSTKEPAYTEVDYSVLADKLDLVLESHSHYSYFHYDSYGLPHMQCGGYLSGMGYIKLGVTFNGNKPTVELKSKYLYNAAALKKCNSSFFETVNTWYSTNVYKEESERIVATLPDSLDSDDINQMQASAYYALKDYPEVESYHISVAGGHIVCRSPKSLSAGNVTMSDVTNLFPFDNEMYVCEIAGRDLKYKFLRDSYALAGEYNSSSTIDFSKKYNIILDSYNYFYLTKQMSNPITLTIKVDLTSIYHIYPRDVFANYLSANYKYEEKLTTSITNTSFTYPDGTLNIEVKDGLDLDVTYANLADNSSYSQFNIKKSTGEIKFVCSSSYIIKNVSIKQYQNYKNLKFYSDALATNELDYTIRDGEYSFTNSTNVFYVKNTSTYDVKLYYINIEFALQ